MKIGDAVEQLFPEGTLDWSVDASSGNERKAPFNPGATDYTEPPADPIDLFVIVAHLLSRSGAYHHVQPETEPPVSTSARRLVIGKGERRSWMDTGRAWAVSAGPGRSDPALRLEVPAEVRRLWAELHRVFGQPLFQPLLPSASCPDWWRTALALLVIADEAALDAGFLADAALHGMLPELLQLAVERRIRDALANRPDGEGFGPYTLSAANEDIACVLPKSRTPMLGCTMRSLSHNLALLPPRGLARARWLAPGRDSMSPDAVSPLNLLLIPYPYTVAAKSFRAGGVADNDSDAGWGWFGVEPDEGKPDEDKALRDFIFELIEEAGKDVGRVHGLVFPELALSGPFYTRLLEELVKRDDIEFFAAGLHSTPEGEHGNHAAAAIIPTSKTKGVPREGLNDVRQKHHRWRLDAAQIASYSLGTVLDPNRSWWEQLDILSRSMTVGVLRGETTITTLICEDLARVDPAQELLRAIGPNIVIALLMDSAQLITRWPSRYATVLAEDPGSSVLTFTSLGLIERVNAAGFYSSRVIALWRDDQGVRELSLANGKHALCITLSPTKIEEGTLDGRTDSRNALSWRLTGVQPVAAKAPIPAWRLFPG